MSLNQQQNLPRLIQATPMPVMYEDSTHQLWDCETKQGSIILKICNSDNVSESTFWQGMSSLFAVELPQQLNEFESVFNMLTTISPLVIPGFIAAGSATQGQQAFIAVKKVEGIMVNASDVDDEMVIQLAQHIAQLHHQTQNRWGRLEHAEFDSQHWSNRLQNSLELLADNHSAIPSDLLDEALELAAKCKVENFAPIMLDLRWDQFLQKNGVLSALVDLDAFVFGPRELEFVLLEYILDEQQAIIFTKIYQQYHPTPDLSATRMPYRLLLFLMNVLGEKEITIWMNSSIRFK